MDLVSLIPTRWYYPSASLGPQPCRWEGWVDFGPSLGRRWIVIDLFGA